MSRKSKTQRRNRNKMGFPNPNELYTHERAIDFTGMFGWLPDPDVILEELGLDHSAYDNILTDAHLFGVMTQRKTKVTGNLWEIDRGEAKTAEATFVQEIFEKIDVYRILKDMMQAPFYGLAPIEVVWGHREDGKVVPVRVIGKPAKWFQYSPENKLRFKSREAQTIGVEIAPRKVIEVRHGATYGNPYGDKILSKVFWPITFKKGGYKFWVQLTEKFGMPLVVGKVPRSNDVSEYEVLAEILANTIQDGIIVMPQDSEVEIIDTASGGGSGIHKELATFSNQEVSKAVLGQTLTTEASDKGTQALGTVHEGVAHDLSSEDKRMCEDGMNQLIRWILEVNFGEVKVAPTFKLYREEDVDILQAQRDQILVSTGQVQLTQQWLDKTYGLEPGDMIVTEKAEENTGHEDENTGHKDKDKDGKFTEFRESIFKDQRAIDILIESMGPKDFEEQLAFQKPLLQLGATADNYEEFQAGLVKIFPKVRPVDMEKNLRNFLFIAQTWGNITGAET